jgi:hypothetical protein
MSTASRTVAALRGDGVTLAAAADAYLTTPRTAARVAEILALNIEDLDLDGRRMARRSYREFRAVTGVTQSYLGLRSRSGEDPRVTGDGCGMGLWKSL